MKRHSTYLIFLVMIIVTIEASGQTTVAHTRQQFAERISASYDSHTVNKLVLELGSELPQKRLLASKALARKTPPVFSTFVSLTHNADWRVRRGTCDAVIELCKLSRKGKSPATAVLDGLKPVIPRFIDLLTDEEPWVRHGAATALGSIGATAGSATDRLVTAAGDLDAWVREAAMSAVTKVTEDESKILAAATAVLLKPDTGFADKRHAIAAIKGLESDYVSALPALVFFIENPGEGMWGDAIVSAMDLLTATDPETVVPLFTKIAAGGSKYYRLAGGPREKAIRYLGELGPAAGPAVPTLRQIQSGEDEQLKEAAQAALSKIVK